MKTRMLMIMFLVGVLSLPTVLHAQQSDPVAVVTGMTEPLNAGDLDAVMAFFADDAVMKVVHLNATFTGAGEVRGMFQGLLAKHFEMHIDEVPKVEGDTVTTRTSMASDDTRSLGVQVISTQTYVVQDGEIKSLTCSWSDETLAALAAATATLPTTGGDLLPMRIAAVGLGGLAAFTGVGWALVRRRLP